MDDTMPVRGGERGRNPTWDRQRLIDLQRAARESVSQSLSIKVLHDEKLAAIPGHPRRRARRCADDRAARSPAPLARTLAEVRIGRNTGWQNS
jgi:hypothetical protein